MFVGGNMETFEEWINEKIPNFNRLSNEEKIEIKQTYADWLQADLDKTKAMRESNEQAFNEANDRADELAINIIDLEKKYGSRKAK